MFRLNVLTSLLLLTLGAFCVASARDASSSSSTSLDRCYRWVTKKGNATNVKRYNDHCYQFNLDEELTYMKAFEHCVKGFGQPVVIKSAEINKFITDSLINDFEFTGSAWIGLNDILKEGTFTWGEGEAIGDYTNFDGSEGFELVKHYIEDCVAIDAGSKPVAGKWRDYRCSSPKSWTPSVLDKHLPFICQYDLLREKKTKA